MDEWTETLKEFASFEWMMLTNPPSWSQIQDTFEFLSNKKILIDETKLFSNFCNLLDFLKNQNTDFEDLMAHEKWVQYLAVVKHDEQNNELFKIACFAFAIPAHNANVERIFSFISSQWSDERNRLTLDNISGILLAQYNFKHFSCEKFHQFAKKDSSFLKMVSSVEKYKF